MSNKPQLILHTGITVECTEPIILSASRSTDIPAFYAQWFINRLKAGYCVWTNPFNQKPTYVSFKKCKVVVFWTKNPKPLIPLLSELDKRGIHYYFQYTLNNYDSEGFEPNIPKLDYRIETFKELSQKIGRERVIWRFDPIIITSQITPRDILKKIWNIGNKIKGHTEKLVFSFIDIKAYKKVQNNLVKTSQFNKENILNSELKQNQIEEICEGLQKMQEIWKTDGWNLKLATCAEEVDLKSYGIEHNRCIDGELMKQIFSEDKDLIYYLKHGKLPENNIQTTLFEDEKIISIEKLKDKGQRKICGCMVSKDIGMYNTCRHFCVYCYANTSQEIVLRNQLKHKDDNESII
ncbi:MAG: DUF1848 domain-containing protein [Bacteroidales bacterium]|nr:DUF1848 domain-containing protein [Bacteroidales bacterium]